MSRMNFTWFFRRTAVFLAPLLLFGAVHGQGSPTSPGITIRSVRAYGVNYVYLRDVARYYGMNLLVGATNAEINSAYSKITFENGRRRGVINGVVVNFLFAPFIRGGEPFISESDFLLVLEPALRHQVLGHNRMRVVVIDPGHGGSDHGARGARWSEKDVVLRISLMLRDILRGQGYHVVMTRSDDRSLSLDERTAIARRANADLFVSVHANAAANNSVTGVETFLLPPADTPSTSESKPSSQVENGNAYDRGNFRLAYEIQRALVNRTGAEDRGVKHARFSVLRTIECPAALVETGFISNPAEERLLAAPAYQRRIAQAIAEGILAYHRALLRK